jgi:transposase
VLGTKTRVFVPHRSLALDQLVPTDDFYRHLEAQLDLGFVRPWVEELYAERGRPSIDPVVFFKLQLILFFEGLRSERQLMRVVADRLSLRWYLGYDFGDALPDHSSLTRIRERYGLPIFQRFFDQVVDLCREAGLVWGEELIIDATKVRANADLDSLVPRFYWRAKQHLADLFAQPTGANDEPTPEEATAIAGDQGAPEAALAMPPLELPVPLTLEQRQQLAETNEARWPLLEKLRLDPERPPAGYYRRITDYRVSITDPDATPITDGRKSSLGYQDHYVVDGGRHRIILAAVVLPGDVMENTPLLDLVRRVSFQGHQRPKRVIADAAYGTGENLRLLEEEGILALMPVTDYEQSTPYFKQADFAYDAARDVYTCPQGATLKARGNSYRARIRAYQAPTETCQACPVRARCTDSTQGRRINRQFDEDYRERARQRQTTHAYRKALRKRAVWVEPLFGEAKDWHGLRRFRLRGSPKVNMEGLRIAAGQNLKRYLSTRGWGRRWGPGGSLVAPPNLRFARLLLPAWWGSPPAFFNSLDR